MPKKNNFKTDNAGVRRITIVFPKPYKAQLDILRSALYDSEVKEIVLNGGRQVGKTLVAIICGMYWALETKGTSVMVISPIDSQTRLIFRKFLEMATQMNFYVKTKRESGADQEIVFQNGSSIKFRSASSKETLRGHSTNYLILDECAFIPLDVLQNIIQPMMSVAGKKTLYCSTPASKSNWFFDKYKSGSSDAYVKREDIKSFKITYKDNPYADTTFIKNAEISLHKDFFAAEYLGEFVDSAGAFPNVRQICKLNPRQMAIEHPCAGRTYYAGIDIGLLRDYTVVIIMSDIGDMVFYDRFTNVEVPELILRLTSVFEQYNCSGIKIERNNQGQGIYQELQRKFPYIEGFYTLGPTKQALINELIAAFSSKSFNLLDDELLISELENFIYTKHNDGRLSFQARSGHDDMVMALGIAWRCKNTQLSADRYQMLSFNINSYGKTIKRNGLNLIQGFYDSDTETGKNKYMGEQREMSRSEECDDEDEY